MGRTMRGFDGRFRRFQLVGVFKNFEKPDKVRKFVVEGTAG